MNYRSIISEYPPVPEKDQLRMLAGSRQERERVLLGYGKTIVKIARKYAKSEQDVEDLFQRGWLGLLHAANKFDPEKKVKPITYFYHWIHEKIRSFTQQNRLIRVTNLAWKLINDYRRMEEETKLTDRDEIIKLLNLSPKRQEILKRGLVKVASIEKAKKDSDIKLDLGYYDDVFKNVCKKEEAEILHKKINTLLSEEEKQYIKLRLAGNTRPQIAKLMGLTNKDIIKKEVLVKKILNEPLKRI